MREPYSSFDPTRRRFLAGCSAAIAATAGARLSLLALDAQASDHTLIVVFLRGGWDGLTVVSPLGDDRRFYHDARPTLAIPDNAVIRLDAGFGLHPAMAPLGELYRSRTCAIVHAAGLTFNTRSHFDAMDYMERGTPGLRHLASGWLARHLETRPTSGQLGVVAVGGQPSSLLGNRDAINLASLDDFSIAAGNELADTQRLVLRQAYAGETPLDFAARRTLDAMNLIERLALDEYRPAPGVIYPDNPFGESLKTIARLLKADVGLHVATLDFGGWDTHEAQGEQGGGGYMAGLLAGLSRGLAAFYADMAHARRDDRVTLVVMSEFGRRVAENASVGTDHGHGSVMLVVGGLVNGGRVYGTWPGLHPQHLFDSADLEITTDYRVVLAEIVSRVLQNPRIQDVFPGLVYRPLGIVR